MRSASPNLDAAHARQGSASIDEDGQKQADRASRLSHVPPARRGRRWRGRAHTGRPRPLGAGMKRTVRTPDGRTLAVQDAGDLAGRPVLVPNGTPMSPHLYGPNAGPL